MLNELDVVELAAVAASLPFAMKQWWPVVLWAAPLCVCACVAGVWLGARVRRCAAERARAEGPQFRDASTLPVESPARIDTLAPAGVEPVHGVLKRAGRRGWTLETPYIRARAGSPLCVSLLTSSGPLRFFTTALDCTGGPTGVSVDIRTPAWIERIERRHAARTEVSALVTAWLSRSDGDGPSLMGAVVVDASSAGCRLRAPMRAEAGERIDIRWSAPDGEVAQVRAAVVSCEPVGRGRTWHWVRCAFVEPPSQLWSELLRQPKPA